MKHKKKKAPGAYLKKRKVKKYQEGGEVRDVKDLLQFLGNYDTSQYVQVPGSEYINPLQQVVSLPAAEVVTDKGPGYDRGYGAQMAELAQGDMRGFTSLLTEHMAMTKGDLSSIYKNLGSEGVDKYLDMTQGVVDAQNQAQEIANLPLYFTPLGTQAFLAHMTQHPEEYNPNTPEGALRLGTALATLGRGKFAGLPRYNNPGALNLRQGVRNVVRKAFGKDPVYQPDQILRRGEPVGTPFSEAVATSAAGLGPEARAADLYRRTGGRRPPSQSGMFNVIEEAAQEAEFARTPRLPGSQTPVARIPEFAKQTFRRDDTAGLAAITKQISNPETKLEDLPRLAQSALTQRHASYDDLKPGYQIIRNALLARGYVDPNRDQIPSYTFAQHRTPNHHSNLRSNPLEDTRTWSDTQTGTSVPQPYQYNPWSGRAQLSNKPTAKNIQQIPLLIGDKFLNKVRKQKGTGLLEIESLKEQLNAKGVKEKDRAIILDLLDNLRDNRMLPEEGYIDPNQLRGYIASYYTDNRTEGRFFTPEDFLDGDGQMLLEDGDLLPNDANSYLNFKYSGYGMKNLGYPVDNNGLEIPFRTPAFIDKAGNTFEVQIYGVAAQNPTLAPRNLSGYLYESQEGHMGHVREIMVTPKDGGPIRHYLVEIQSNALQKNQLPTNIQHIEPTSLLISSRPELDPGMAFLNKRTGLDAEAIHGQPDPFHSILWGNLDPYSEFRQHGRILEIPEMVEDAPHAYNPKYWRDYEDYITNLLRKMGSDMEYGTPQYQGRSHLIAGTARTRQIAAQELSDEVREAVRIVQKKADEKGFVTFLPLPKKDATTFEIDQFIESHPFVESVRVSDEGYHVVELKDDIKYVTRQLNGTYEDSRLLQGDADNIAKILSDHHWSGWSDKHFFGRQEPFFGYVPVSFAERWGQQYPTMYPDEVMAPLQKRFRQLNLANQNASLSTEDYLKQEGQLASRLAQYLEMNDLNPPGTFTDARLQDSFDAEAEVYNVHSMLRERYEEINSVKEDQWDSRAIVPKNNPEQKALLKNKTQFMLTEYLTDLIGSYNQRGPDARIFVPTPETAAAVQGFYQTTAYHLAEARTTLAEFQTKYKEAEEGLQELREKYGIKALEPRFFSITTQYRDPLSHSLTYENYDEKKYPRLTRDLQPDKGYERHALPADIPGADRQRYKNLLEQLDTFSTENPRVQRVTDKVANLEKTLEDQKKSGVKHFYGMAPDGSMVDRSGRKMHFTVKAYADMPKVLKDMGIKYKEHTDDMGNTWLELDLSAAQRIGAGTFKAYQRGGKVIKKSPFKLIKK